MEYTPIKDFEKLKGVKNKITRIKFTGKGKSFLKNYEGYFKGKYYFTDMTSPSSTKQLKRYSCDEVEELSKEGILMIRPENWEENRINKNQKGYEKIMRKVLLSTKNFKRLSKKSSALRKKRIEELVCSQI